jgi:hypothetical protein
VVLIFHWDVVPPHPEECTDAIAAVHVSKDVAAPWFETRSFAALLTMRIK